MREPVAVDSDPLGPVAATGQPLSCSGAADPSVFSAIDCTEVPMAMLSSWRVAYCGNTEELLQPRVE